MITISTYKKPITYTKYIDQWNGVVYLRLYIISPYGYNI